MSGETKSGAVDGGSVDRCHRQWCEAQKRQVFAETDELGVLARMVAWRSSLSTNQSLGDGCFANQSALPGSARSCLRSSSLHRSRTRARR